MGNRLHRLAIFGLVLSLVSFFIFIGLLIVKREWGLAVQISLGISILGFAVFVLLDPERVRQWLSGKKARHSSNALILAVAFLGSLLIINYLVYRDSQQNPRRLDLTENKTFTLSQETLAVIDALDEHVYAQAFYSQQYPSDTPRDALEQYKMFSAGKFDYIFIDPYDEPVAAEQANISQDGSIALSMGDNRQIVTKATEQEITSALVRLMNPEQRAVYFLTGHGEYSIDGVGEQSYAQIKRVLESKNYKVDSLNLVSVKHIPDNAEVIVIAAPQKPISEAEMLLLDGFLADGKSIIILQEPPILTDFGDDIDPMTAYLTENWGITMGEDIVIDQSSPSPFEAVGVEWGNHPIVNNLRDYAVILPGARSVSLMTAPAGVSQALLVSTAAQTWAETDTAALMEGDEVQYDPDIDLAGPVPLSAVGENFTSDARVVIFGDADFATDVNYRFYGNMDLFVNAVDWASGEEELIDLTLKAYTQRFLVPPQPTLVNIIFLITVIVIPGSALIAGIVAWIQRRKRG
ncbi:MAG: Gldg family protein [Chloroflexota bacterium]|nr:Gldg family protein [Chloroflexota bacterium]